MNRDRVIHWRIVAAAYSVGFVSGMALGVYSAVTLIATMSR